MKVNIFLGSVKILEVDNGGKGIMGLEDRIRKQFLILFEELTRILQKCAI
jgi:hypothetical protein